MANLLHNDSVCRALGRAAARGDASMGTAPGLLEQIIDGEMWRERIIPESGEVVRFERFSDFVVTQPLNGLGTTPKVLRALCQDDAETLEKLERLLNGEVPAAQTHGTNRHNSRHAITSLAEVQSSSTGVPYTIARLKRDAPDLAELVINGEISAAEGRRRAGWEKEKIAIRLDDPASAAKTIRGRASAEYIEELIMLLKGDAAARTAPREAGDGGGAR